MARLIAIDYETHPISVEHPAPKPVCLSWAEGNKSGIFIGDDIRKFMETILSGSNITVIAHNLKFEMLVTAAWYPDLEPLIWDAYADRRLVCTMVDEKILNNFENKVEQRTFDLASLTLKYLNKDISAGKKDPDAWRLRYNELDGVPLAEWPEAALDYAIQDSVYALAIHDLQKAADKGLSYKSTRADFVLGLAANRGMTVEPGRVSTLKAELMEKLTPGYLYLQEQGLGQLDPLTGKFKKNMNVFRDFVATNAENAICTPKGTISTTTEAMTNYIPKADADPRFKEILKTFLNLAMYEKILSAFIPALESAVKKGGLIRTNYNPVVSTGRTSSSGSSLYPSANIQQMPRELKGVTYDVRNCYKAREGYKLVSIDYGGLELCATAHQLFAVYGKSRMKDLINEGDTPMDLHSRFAAQVMTMDTGEKIDYQTFLARKKEKTYARYRQICKALNLGFPGGIGYEVMGTQLFKEGIEISNSILKGPDGKPVMAFSEKQAAYFLMLGRNKNPNLRIKRIAKTVWVFVIDELVGLKQRYFEMYPEIEVFLKETHNYFLTGEHKMQKNEFGEWEKEPLYKFNIAGMKRNYAMYTQFCNGFLMQSPSAQGAKQMLWEVAYEYKDSDEVHLDAFIHDEIVIEVKDNENFEKNVDKVAKIMIQSMQKVLPSVRVNVEASAMTYWSKGTPKGELENLYWMDPGSGELKAKRGKG
jgi:hypothetical protein